MDKFNELIKEVNDAMLLFSMNDCVVLDDYIKTKEEEEENANGDWKDMTGDVKFGFFGNTKRLDDFFNYLISKGWKENIKTTETEQITMFNAKEEKRTIGFRITKDNFLLNCDNGQLLIRQYKN